MHSTALLAAVLAAVTVFTAVDAQSNCIICPQVVPQCGRLTCGVNARCTVEPQSCLQCSRTVCTPIVPPIPLPPAPVPAPPAPIPVPIVPVPSPVTPSGKPCDKPKPLPTYGDNDASYGTTGSSSQKTNYGSYNEATTETTETETA